MTQQHICTLALDLTRADFSLLTPALISLGWTVTPAAHKDGGLFFTRKEDTCALIGQCYKGTRFTLRGFCPDIDAETSAIARAYAARALDAASREYGWRLHLIQPGAQQDSVRWTLRRLALADEDTLFVEINPHGTFVLTYDPVSLPNRVNLNGLFTALARYAGTEAQATSGRDDSLNPVGGVHLRSR